MNNAKTYSCASEQEYKSWINQCKNILERLDVSPENVISTSANLPSKDKTLAYCTDTIADIARELLAGDKCNWRVVLRSWGLAKTYKGSLGHLPANLSDVMMCIEILLCDRMIKSTIQGL